MTFGRAARWSGVVAFVAVELLVAFGSYIVVAIRCCGASPAGPADVTDWATLVIFAVVMIIPAALIGCGVAMLVHAIGMGMAVIARRSASRAGTARDGR